MRSAVKAALISAFFFPGLGQMYLKRYIRGLAIVLPVLGGIAIMVVATSHLSFSAQFSRFLKVSRN